MSDAWVHFTVEETEDGWIVWAKITTSSRRYQGPASPYPFPSAKAAWRWAREQFGPDLPGDPAGEDVDDEGRHQPTDT